MKQLLLLALLLLATSLGSALALDYEETGTWYKLAPGRPEMGNQHGDVAIASNGEVYVSIIDPKAAIQVYAPDGTFLRVVPNAPPDLHGFIIHKEADGEFIYGPRLGAGNIVKLTLDGQEVLNIPPRRFRMNSKARTRMAIWSCG